MSRKRKPKLLVGYHYTSFYCWRRIQTEGLQPYTIRKPEFIYVLGTDSVTGVWVWTKPIAGLAHRGCILYQMGTKNTLMAVLLRVEFDEGAVLCGPKEKDSWVMLYHSGHIEHLEYHTGREEAVILKEPVPPSQITLLKEYNLMDIWNEDEAYPK